MPQCIFSVVFCLWRTVLFPFFKKLINVSCWSVTVCKNSPQGANAYILFLSGLFSIRFVLYSLFYNMFWMVFISI
jgi:hypothetical protein